MLTNQENYDTVNLDNEYNNDTVTEKDKSKVIVKQEDSYLSYLITGLLKENSDKFISRRNLYKNPPKLTILDDLGNEIEFNLTREFTTELNKSLNQVLNAYNGYSYYISENDTLKTKLIKFKNEIKSHPYRYGVILAIILLLSVSNLFI